MDEGKVTFQVVGRGMIKGEKNVNDGETHIIAIRFDQTQSKWSILVDGE